MSLILKMVIKWEKITIVAYPVSYYDGKKYVVLSTTNAFGGKNLLLGGLYIAAGVLSFIAAIAFTIGFYKKQKSN